MHASTGAGARTFAVAAAVGEHEALQPLGEEVVRGRALPEPHGEQQQQPHRQCQRERARQDADERGHDGGAPEVVRDNVNGADLPRGGTHHLAAHQRRLHRAAYLQKRLCRNNNTGTRTACLSSLSGVTMRRERSRGS